MQLGNQALNNITGIPIKKDARIVIIKTEWNSDITNVLETSCVNTLTELGINDIKKYSVPGAVELPFAVQHCWQNNKNIDCIIVFGCVIKGGTPHFEYVCKMVTEGINQLNITLPIPTVFGVLTVDFKEQAIDRIKGGRVGDVGAQSAITAIKLFNFMDQTLQ
jgi:6,7-dimethyl-8-ribityllumazine synthase